MSRELPIVALLEDDPVVWYARTAPRWSTRRAHARDWHGTPRGAWRRITVTAEYLRNATTEDCPAAVHAVDDPERVDPRSDECRCQEIQDDGYCLPCDPAHPDAIAVWRCEPQLPPLWWMRFRRWQFRVGLAHRGRPVLWGGRVDRETTWLDRALFGGWTGKRLTGDRYFRLGEAELRHCDTCGHVTSHRLRWDDTIACRGPMHDALWFDAEFPARSSAGDPL